MMKKIIFIGCLVLSLAKAKAQTKTEKCTLYPFDYKKSIGAGIVEKSLIPTKVFYEKCPIENIYIDSLIKQKAVKKIFDKLGRNDDDVRLFKLVFYKYQNINSGEYEAILRNIYIYSESPLLPFYTLEMFLVNPYNTINFMRKDTTNNVFKELYISMNDFYSFLKNNEVSRIFNSKQVTAKDFIIDNPPISKYYKIHPSILPYLDKTKKYLRFGAYIDSQIKRTDFYSKEDIELLKKIRTEICKPVNF